MGLSSITSRQLHDWGGIIKAWQRLGGAAGTLKHCPFLRQKMLHFPFVNEIRPGPGFLKLLLKSKLEEDCVLSNTPDFRCLITS